MSYFDDAKELVNHAKKALPPPARLAPWHPDPACLPANCLAGSSELGSAPSSHIAIDN